MKYTIKSDKLTAVIDSFGAELCSVKDASGREYIWTAEDVWKRHAPLLSHLYATLLQRNIP